MNRRFIAFLRAINVGGHNVKMDHLLKLFEALEFSKVETFIASGNVIFETPSEDAQMLEKKIESYLRQSLGYEVATFLRSPAEVAAIARHQPLPTAELEVEGHSLYVAFLPAPPGSEARQKLMVFQTEVDEFHLHGRELYWLVRRTAGESTFSGALLEKTVGMPATVRNITTVRRLVAKYTAG